MIALSALVGTLLYPVYAHNVSWNKAVLCVEGKRVTLTLRISQFDLLDTIAPGRWKELYRNKAEWQALLPEIRCYIFDNVALMVNDTLLADGVDLSWRLEYVYPSEEIPADTNLGVLELARYWNIDTVPETIVLIPNLLKNCAVPVKWVILLKSDYTVARVYPQVVDRGDVACYNFRKQAWVVQADTMGCFWQSITEEVRSIWRRVTGGNP